MRRLVILASVVVVASSSVNCANSPERSNVNTLAPSTFDAVTSARHGGGGGRPGGGGRTGGGTIAGGMVPRNNHDGVPSFTDTVTFAVQTTATAYPYVTLTCTQNGTVVSQESNAMFAGSLDENFTLGPTALWKGGAAICTATLESRDSSKNGSTVL